MAEVTCYGYNEKGHFKAECPTQKKEKMTKKKALKVTWDEPSSEDSEEEENMSFLALPVREELAEIESESDTESEGNHAILSYLACAFPGIPDHWYPADLTTRAKIHSILDWHHSNLRRGSMGFVLNSTLAPALGLPLNPQAAKEAEKVLSESLSHIESVWLKGNAKFLLGNFRPSIADLSLVCEIMQLEVVDDKDRERLLGPHPIILQWVDNLKSATKPHFDEVHEVLFKLKERLRSRVASTTNDTTDLKMKANPKL
ncbi:glutathione S-transferase T1-like [Curcuma longa]|uniref:glutathione S-transferase T1-like n=1 Tax=Curcuma longa TaxID=136217 RepID=UPI003D9EB201